MGILIITIGVAILLVLVATFLYLTRIEKTIMNIGLENTELHEGLANDLTKLSAAVKNQFHELEKMANPPAHVSDPFKRPKEQYQSTKHIVVPKTPTEIRNENFEEIKKGATYGYSNQQ